MANDKKMDYIFTGETLMIMYKKRKYLIMIQKKKRMHGTGFDGNVPLLNIFLLSPPLTLQVQFGDSLTHREIRGNKMVQ